MKKINLWCAVFAACGMALSLGAARNDSDPEVLSSKGGKRNYAGVYPVKTIAIITPGSYPNPKTAKPAINLLRKAGYKVKVYPNVFLRPKGVEKNRYLSSPVEVRVKDFEAAWSDMENDMILCARGGCVQPEQGENKGGRQGEVGRGGGRSALRNCLSQPATKRTPLPSAVAPGSRCGESQRADRGARAASSGLPRRM